MRAVTYKFVIDKISGYLGEDGGMSGEDKGIAARLFQTRIRGAWEYFWWPELMGEIVRAYFRPLWDSLANYAIGTEIYYPGTQKYYSLLRALSGFPADPPADANGATNLSFWADTSGSCSADLYDPNATYTQGMRAFSPDTNSVWQLFALTSQGVAPPDGTRWGPVQPFVRSLSYTLVDGTQLGEVKALWDRNPDVDTNARKMPFTLRPSFILVRGTLPFVWIEYRTQPSDYSGLNWAAGTFQAGTQVYYDPLGDYFKANTTTTTPPGSADWDRVPVPYILSEYLAQSVHAAMVSKEEEVPEDFSIELTAGYPFILAELQKIERQQGQTRQLNVTNSRPGGW